MKTYHYYGFLALLLAFTFGCKKTDIAPQSILPERNSLTQDQQAGCPYYFYYQGNTPRDLGPMYNDKILVGFKKGTNQVNKLMVLGMYPQLDAIIGTTSTNAAELTIVSLKPNISCTNLDKLLKDLPVNPHVDFAGGYFDYEYYPGARIGITNTFIVSFKPTTTASDLENLLKQTKTEIFEDLGFGTYIVRITKQSPKDCLNTTNQFYESGLFETAEPDFFFEFPPMQ